YIGKLDFAIIDYIQLVKSEGSGTMNRVYEIQAISQEIKDLSKELNIPIIALAQFNRELKKRANQEPDVDDIRDSASIGHDADFIGLLFPTPKPEEANNSTPQYEPPPTANTTKEYNLKVAKNRAGRNGHRISLVYYPALTMFKETFENDRF
ncbi:MAG: hypothetical protein EBR82_80550, partial [Caulobacteraceae bacterium]|nr:hypothetical protein [Caulobacteraceae bacterium]